MLSGAARLGDADDMRPAILSAVEHVTTEIANLRALITELRPAALDQLGLLPALSSLLQRTESTTGLEIESELRLGEGDARLPGELETTVYRLVQEALTNVARHADARRVTVRVRDDGAQLDVLVADDGRGMPATGGAGGGFGLVGMRERVELAGGEITVTSGESGGTVVRARLPVPARSQR
jgi:signal transduction histidine kinase